MLRYLFIVLSVLFLSEKSIAGCAGVYIHADTNLRSYDDNEIITVELKPFQSIHLFAIWDACCQELFSRTNEIKVDWYKNDIALTTTGAAVKIKNWDWTSILTVDEEGLYSASFAGHPGYKKRRIRVVKSAKLNYQTNTAEANVLVVSNNSNVTENVEEEMRSRMSEESTSLEQFEFYPNPIIDQVSIKFSLMQAATASISIFNNQGQQVLYKSQYVADGIFEQQLSVVHLPSGIYFIRITADDQQATKQFVKG